MLNMCQDTPFLGRDGFKSDGSWLDLIPQTPDQSIFFHQSGELRRRNEMSFYGYTFSMEL